MLELCSTLKTKKRPLQNNARDESNQFFRGTTLIGFYTHLTASSNAFSNNVEKTVSPTCLRFQLTAQGRARTLVQPLFYSNQQLS